MGRIYKQARRTFVWLSERDEYSNDGIAALTEACVNLQHAPDESRRMEGTDVEVKPVNVSPRDQEACASILSRNCVSWYWILLEALLSPRYWS